MAGLQKKPPQKKKKSQKRKKKKETDINLPCIVTQLELLLNDLLGEIIQEDEVVHDREKKEKKERKEKKKKKKEILWKPINDF